MSARLNEQPSCCLFHWALVHCNLDPQAVLHSKWHRHDVSQAVIWMGGGLMEMLESMIRLTAQTRTFRYHHPNWTGKPQSNRRCRTFQ